MSKCQVCGRELRSAASIARGVGAACARKKKGKRREVIDARLPLPRQEEAEGDE